MILKSYIPDLLQQIGASALDARKNRIESEKPVYLGGSISHKTQNLVMTFPTMCDNSLPPSTASMINKANERNIVTMLQLLFSSISIKGSDGAEVLSRIHTNINASMGMDEIIDKLDDYAERNIADSNMRSRLGFNENANINHTLRLMVEELKTPHKSFPVESLSERSLADYTVFNFNDNIVVKEDGPFAKYDDSMIHSMSGDQLDLLNKQNRARLDRDALNLNQQRAAQDALRNKKNEVDMRYDMLTKQLLDSDVKKANEMVPSLMIIQYNEMADDGSFMDRKSFVAGVKSRLVSVDSLDIVERVAVKNKTKLNFLNFVRAWTGEIKFVRDFLLCIDQAKIDAKNSVKKGTAAQMWKVLEQRSSKNYRNKHRRSGNDASAITTLVINQETVNMIKREYDFDLENIANARSIIEAYNLLGLIIADESVEVVKFLYAGNDMFETQAYSYLEKESNDNSYKKVINLMGKMNGR